MGRGIRIRSGKIEVEKPMIERRRVHPNLIVVKINTDGVNLVEDRAHVLQNDLVITYTRKRNHSLFFNLKCVCIWGYELLIDTFQKTVGGRSKERNWA
jgi:hypothetical protein